MNVYGSNTQGAINHWQNQGLPVEGRRGSIIFDPVYYLAHNSDLRAAYGSNGYLAALQHFMAQGLPVEGRRGSLEFDVKYYLAHYSDLANTFGTNYLAAADHFLNTGLPREGRRGSADFSVQDYLTMYPDVSSTSGAMGTGAGPMHWLQRGKALGRHGFGSLPPSTECSNGSTTEFGTVPLGTTHVITVSRAPSYTGTVSVSYINPPGSQTILQPDGNSIGPGHYSVSAGTYTFNPGDAEQPIQITYNFNPIPAQYSRIFFGHNRPPTAQGTMADPIDASVLDFTLRTISEGLQPPIPNFENGGGAPYGPHNLIVCLGTGVFPTSGVYDWVINVHHTTPNPGGFTLNQNWHLHGQGAGSTTLQLSRYLANPPTWGFPQNTGLGIVLGTIDDNASGVEVSDMTIDGNYPNLGGSIPINLLAINLRSTLGGHNIHNIKVINTAGQVGSISETFEAFLVSITSINGSSSTSNNNVIQYVFMDQFAGGRDTSINISNVMAEVAYNVVNGHEIGFGGFSMPAVSFHDNVAVNNTSTGFITDSGVNANVHVDFNQIINPGKYGIVLGGGSSYTGFQFTWNNIFLQNNNAIGIVFQGNVQSALVARNNITAPGSVPGGRGLHFVGTNTGNSFQYNQINGQLSNDSPLPNCAFSNWNESGVQLTNFNTQNAPCQ